MAVIGLRCRPVTVSEYVPPITLLPQPMALVLSGAVVVKVKLKTRVIVGLSTPAATLPSNRAFRLSWSGW